MIFDWVRSEHESNTGGCTSGAIFSALILVFIVYRFLPKVSGEKRPSSALKTGSLQKTLAVPVLVGGWGALAWMASQAWNNLSGFLATHHKLVAAYFVSDARNAKIETWPGSDHSDDRVVLLLLQAGPADG